MFLRGVSSAVSMYPSSHAKLSANVLGCVQGAAHTDAPACGRAHGDEGVLSTGCFCQSTSSSSGHAQLKRGCTHHHLPLQTAAPALCAPYLKCGSTLLPIIPTPICQYATAGAAAAGGVSPGWPCPPGQLSDCSKVVGVPLPVYFPWQGWATRVPAPSKGAPNLSAPPLQLDCSLIYPSNSNPTPAVQTPPITHPITHLFPQPDTCPPNPWPPRCPDCNSRDLDRTTHLRWVEGNSLCVCVCVSMRRVHGVHA